MVIAVINNKGGTGKTTTCVNLSAALANLGYRVLLLDLDSQASASISMGIHYNELSPSMADVLFEDAAIEDIKRRTNIPGLDLVTGGVDLAHSDLILADVSGRENLLRTVLRPVRDSYDYILCDCPPSLSLLSINALAAADRYIVPVTPDYLALEGLISLMNAVDRFREGIGVDLKLLGIVFNMVSPGIFSQFNRGLKGQWEIIRLVQEHYSTDVLETMIKKNVKIAEAPSYDASIIEYAPGSNAAKQYDNLAHEILKRFEFN